MTQASSHRAPAAWSALRAHHAAIADLHMRDLFAQDPGRAARFRLEACGLLLDYSRHRITAETVSTLARLAAESNLEESIGRLFAGDLVNHTENRAALHPALRFGGDGPFPPGSRDVMPGVRATQEKMRGFCAQVRGRRWRGVTERPLDTVVMLGIGGSHQGPAMAWAALECYADAGLGIRFVSDLDGAALSRVLKGCSPERTLFIVASKSFTTEETLANAAGARSWLESALGNGEIMARHFVAVTARPQRAVDFGIEPGNVFEMGDWVGGRYSLWSAVGLPVALGIGMDAFEALLAGAAGMDDHFRRAPAIASMPAVLALLEVWYRNAFGAGSRVVLAYDHGLRRFPRYLQQLEMESNGKRVGPDGAVLDHATAPVVWGAGGSEAQHAFAQLLHQGTDLIPADFIVPLESQYFVDGRNEAVVANALAQSRALMLGRSEEAVRRELEAAGAAGAELAARVPHRVHPGNQPSSLLIYERLDPRTLGALCALYEHKVFVESVLWQTNPFDQFGVELGKRIAGEIRPAVAGALEEGRGGPLGERVDRLLAACPADGV